MFDPKQIAAALETVAIDNGFKLFPCNGEIYAIEIPVTNKSAIHPMTFLGSKFEDLRVVSVSSDHLDE